MNKSKRGKDDKAHVLGIRNKLSSLADTFNGFEQQIQQKKARRKGDDEKKFIEIKADLIKIDQEIKVESKRRVETSNALDTLFHDKLEAFKKEVEERARKNTESVLVAIAELNRSVDALAEQVDAEARKFPKITEEKTTELLTQIAEFKAKFEADRASQSEKLDIVQKIIEEQQYRVNQQLQTERVTRASKVDELEKQMSVEAKLRKKTAETLTQYLKDQSEIVNNSMDKCEKAREKTMEELVSMFCHYTSALQDGVKILADTPN